MTTRTRFFFPLIALALAVPIGCASKDTGPVDTAEAPEPIVAAVDDADPADRGDVSDKGAPSDAPAADAWLRTLTSDLDLRPDQKQAIDRAIGELEAKGVSLKDARKQLASALADQVAAGSVDEGKLPVDLVGQAASSLRTAFGDALAKIHAALDPSQRHELASQMRARGGKHHARGGKQGPGHRGKAGKGKGGKHRAQKRIARLTAELNLTPEQVAKLQAKVKARAEARRERRQNGGGRGHGPGPGRGRGRAGAGAQGDEPKDRGSAIADAFDGDRFDAKALERDDDAPHGHDMAASMAAFAQDALPVLTAGQRAKLAEMLRTHDGEMGRGHR